MGFFHTIFLSDGFRPVRPLPFGNPHPGGLAIIKSRLCRKAAKVGGGQGPPVERRSCHETKNHTALHFRAKAAAGREAETMQHLGEICTTWRSRGKCGRNSYCVKARRDFQTAGLNGVFGYFCRRGQKYPAPRRGTSLLHDATALPRHISPSGASRHLPHRGRQGGRIPTPVCTPRALASRRALARNDRVGLSMQKEPPGAVLFAYS